jgi:hypothetical protein
MTYRFDGTNFEHDRMKASLGLFWITLRSLCLLSIYLGITLFPMSLLLPT